MLIVSIVPLLVALLGLVIFLLAKSNGDAKEVGRCLFWCGVLVTLMVVAHKTVTIGGGQ